MNDDPCRSPLRANAVHAGMAHFPQTGPPGTFCRNCGYFNEPALICLKFCDMMKVSERRAPKIQGAYASCRYFMGMKKERYEI
jgi:hypothetical protein